MREKLSCLILDDEHLLRELLKRSIKWDFHNMELLSEASSAMEAIDQVEQYQPNLIFVDICMPIMDGIEFSTIILKRYPHIKIIILTGHDSFDYARQSLKIGVSDFLLKPTNSSEINITLDKVCREIRDDKKRLKEHKMLKKQLDDNLPLLKERFLADLVSGTLSPDEVKNKSCYYHINFHSDQFQVSLLEPSIKEKKGSEEENLFLQFQCIEYIKCYFYRQNDILVFIGNRNKIVLINSNSDFFQSDYYESIKENLINSFNCSISMGVGTEKKGIDSISRSYDEAFTALNYKVIEGKNNVISFSDINLRKQLNCKDLSNSLNEFTFYLNAGISDKSILILSEILEEKCTMAIPDLSYLQIPSVNILSRILNTVREQDIEMKLFALSLTELYNRVFIIETLPEMIKYLSELILTVANTINKTNSQKTGKLISDVKKYLREEYLNHDLSQNLVAEKFFVNSSYLSRKFKKETGQSFVDYLSKIRLKRAIVLLQETDKRNYEISEEIGIADPHYFSIFFKKYMNMSISEYRKKILK
jgi:two-component system, response regulator YesN